VLAVSALHSPRPVQACGGFFCSGSNPVNQAAERIIFVDHGDGRVTAVVQILYQGPTAQFAWVLPVPSLPEIGLSSNMAFQRLQAATNPRYQLDTTFLGDCFPPQSGGGGQDAASGGDTASDGGGGVRVEVQGSVGPYDYEVLSVDPELEDPAQVAVDWLVAEGYDLMGIGPDVLRPYLEQEDYLVAFRLTKTAQAGDIRPVVLEYQDDYPMIPIRPTAVAATANMGVLVWVLGPSRAIPLNYRNLVLNEALLNWLNPGSSYDAVVIAAANEAGGHGFVTELASSSNALREVVFAEWEDSQFQAARESDWFDPIDLLEWATESYYGWDGYVEAFREQVPLPEGVTAEDAAANPRLYLEETGVPGFDAAAFWQALEDNVVQPMRDTQALLQQEPMVTRLYTTLSANEMTEDPDFEFNPEAAEVSNVHRATRVIDCTEAPAFEAPWWVELEDGSLVYGVGSSWPYDPGGDLPANQLIEQYSTEDRAVITDNSQAIQERLREDGRAIDFPCCVGLPEGDVGQGSLNPGAGANPGYAGDDGGGCSQGGVALPGWVGVALALALRPGRPRWVARRVRPSRTRPRIRVPSRYPERCVTEG
jgi:hypothetical protein